MKLKRESIARSLEKQSALSACFEFVRSQSERMDTSLADKCDALRYLDANLNTMELFASAALCGFKNAKERKSALTGRVFEWAGELLDGGRRPVSAEEILEDLRVLDEKEMLRTREIEYASDVIKLRAAENFLYSCLDALSIQREKIKAEQWMENPNALPAGCDSAAFFEHAFQRCMEANDDGMKLMLLRLLSLSGRTEDECVNQSQNEESDARVRMENCLSVCRTLDEIDWEKAFEEISFTEITLLHDPSGVYGQMDLPSRRAILHENAVIAERTGHPERVCASLAVEAAEAFPESGICSVLYTDPGRKELLKRLNAEKVRIPPVYPDPNGRKMTAIIVGAFFVFYALTVCFVNSFVVSLAAIPAVWMLSANILRSVFSKMYRPRPLLKLEMQTVPEEAATLVVIPALIPNANRVPTLLRQLEAMGALNKQDSVEFLLLGDFSDSDEENRVEDRAILELARKEIAQMNRRAGREKYHYLHRNRVFNDNDHIWMGHERKRGALCDLNEVLLSGENRFGAEGGCAEKLSGRFRYVITVDADTEMIPGTIEKLIGAIHHPLNRSRDGGKGYAVIQPRMERMPSKNENCFSRLMGGVGGADNYHSCASEMIQDFCGRGVYNGKGIYDVRAFSDRCAGVFRENTVLSHDLMEGIVAGAGYAGDISLFEGFPSGPTSYLKRQERWTRGDWQLLSLFFGKIKIAAIDRLRILDNLIRSLADTSLCALFILAVWENLPQAAMVAFIALFLPSVWGGWSAAKASTGRMLLLPSLMVVNQGAIGRAVYRMLISHKRMLEWVTAAEAETLTGGKNTSGIAQTILLLPAFANPAWIPYALIMGTIFSFGRTMLEKYSLNDSEPRFTAKEFACLLDTARSTWKYFERFVPLDGNGLPPDNVQIEPAKGPAERTSLTNIGMYLMSCVAAAEMGIICEQEKQARILRTLKTLHSLKQWNGLHYNWYDTKTELPLSPEYVSSVDCGNLLAALVLLRNAEEDERILEIVNELIDKMDLTKLYDSSRKLFYIGFDTERDTSGNAHYDLMASESRILSYVAMAEKGIPVQHWETLGRPNSRVMAKSVLMSWSGTMFEYMMPFLFVSSAPGTMLHESAKGAVKAQIRDAVGKDRPWGVSECAYWAFDREMNYQYRAFGVPELAISGEDGGNVIAPYATMLSLPVEPYRAAENLLKLNETGLRGEMGLYEAGDYENGENVVYAYMTHHQGMALCAICNAVTGNRLCEMFMRGARENALKVLLNEKPFAKPRLFKKERVFQRDFRERTQNAIMSRLRTVPEPDSGKGHLLFGKDSCAYIGADGSGCLKRNGVFANLWHGEPWRYCERMLPEFRENGQKVEMKRAVFDAGTCAFSGESENARYEIRSCVSQETGAWLFEAKATAVRDSVLVACRQSFTVALCNEEAMLSHPSFQGLFVVPEKYAPGVWRFTRRKRLKSDPEYTLYHASSGGEILNFSDSGSRKREPIPPREGNRPLRQDALLEMEAKVPENETVKMYFAVQIAEKGEDFRNDMLTEAEFERAMTLSAARDRTLLDFYGVYGAAYRRLMRDTPSLFLINRQEAKEGIRLTGKELWKYGISGKAPVLLAFMKNEGQAETVRQLLREHGYLNACGASVMAVIVYESENSYFQPIRDRVQSMKAASRFRDKICLIEKNNLSPEETYALKTLAINGKTVKPARNPDFRYLPIKEELPPTQRIADCGMGGFTPDGFGYEIDLRAGVDTPAPWVNILANPDFGALITEKGGGFLWHRNSRTERITPFDNDPVDEGFGIRLYAENENGVVPLLPGKDAHGAYRVIHRMWETVFECASDTAFFRTEWTVDAEENVMYIRVQTMGTTEKWMIKASVDWQMGEDNRDRRYLHTEWKNGFVFATGKMEGLAFLTAESACYEDGFLKANVTSPILIGWAENEQEAEQIRTSCCFEKSIEKTRRIWMERMTRIEADTGDKAVNAIVNRFCKAQALSCRMFARTGLYQPGGAFGFRDQVQDLLCVLYMDAEIARKHILNAASHQFQDGDGMHWWHEPRTGVRTGVSDDVVFLPYLCAKYVLETGDKGILNEKVAYLENEQIAPGSEDWYGDGRISGSAGTLHEHCMRAVRHAARTGEHGLALMGACDWNDGMNRIGARGRGESVWLSEFLSFVAREYAEVCDGNDRSYLIELSERLKTAVDETGWDDEWYLRAYDDDAVKIGSNESEECKIDLIAQAWAAINNQNLKKVEKALESADKWLTDHSAHLIKLIEPPFSGRKYDPGYLASYPAGVRENGGQYTHAAAWLAMAFARMGNAEKAWEIFRMLLPVDRTDTLEKTLHYRAEPYALAADICSSEGNKGVAGWTWYTGAAAWTVRVLYEELLGLRIRGEYAEMRALLPEDQKEMSITIRKGNSVYRLFSGRYEDGRKTEQGPVEMVDDGQTHTYYFPSR